MAVRRVFLEVRGLSPAEPDVRVVITSDSCVQIIVAGYDPVIVNTIEEAHDWLAMQPALVPNEMYGRIVSAMNRTRN